MSEVECTVTINGQDVELGEVKSVKGSNMDTEHNADYGYCYRGVYYGLYKLQPEDDKPFEIFIEPKEFERLGNYFKNHKVVEYKESEVI